MLATTACGRIYKTDFRDFGEARIGYFTDGEFFETASVSPYAFATWKRRSAYVAYYLQLAGIYACAPDEAGHGECGKREREGMGEKRTAALPANSRRPAIFTRTIK